MRDEKVLVRAENWKEEKNAQQYKNFCSDFKGRWYLWGEGAEKVDYNTYRIMEKLTDEPLWW